MITINFDSKSLAEALETAQESVHSQVVEVLRRAGMEAVSRQRDAHLYLDQSGNLTSSIGFIVTDKGERKDLGGFEPTQGKNPRVDSLSPEQAVAEGERVAEEMMHTHSDQATLSVVAGMQYASYVEDKGLNVLSTGRIVAEQLVSEGLESLKL